jgi:DNA-binding NarL/FixJ family response regulator
MNLLLFDDHPLFGVGFVHALTRARDTVRVQSALTLDAGLQIATAWSAIDAVLIDYRLGGDNGLAGLRAFGARLPLVARVLISGDEDPQLAVGARAAGAAGFLSKSLSIDDLLVALDAICDGGEYFPRPDSALREARSGAVTPRQLEVLTLVARGRQNKNIADDLGIAERTVKLHITALLSLTGARNRTHLVARARELGLL